MERFEEDLLRHINSQETDEQGENGRWIKATKHSRWYNYEKPKHTDVKGFQWNQEVTGHYRKGDILIYKDRSNRNYFILPEWQTYFEESHRNFRLKGL